MKCPNCGFEAPEGTDECPKCQLVFRKWQQSAINKAVEAQAESRDEHKDDSSLTLRLFGMFLICAGLYWLVRPGEKPAASAEPATPPVAAEAQPGAPTPEALLLAAAGPAESRWKFEGKVLDLLRGKPVFGVKLFFVEPATGRNFSAETDYDGHYVVELRPLENGGYEAQLSHPDFGGRWWDADSVKLAKKKRYQLTGKAPAKPDSFTGKPGAAVALDFAIFPGNLTAEEQKELCAAAPGGPGC